MLYVCLLIVIDYVIDLGLIHYGDVKMGMMASQITSLTIVYSTVYSGADQRKRKLRVTGFCAGNSPGTGEFPTQMVSNAENVSISWRHHVPWEDEIINNEGTYKTC